MKRIAIVCALMCIIGSTALSAQNRGDMYISGSLSLSGGTSTDITGNTSTKHPEGISLGLSPQFGYFIMDNLELHLGLYYNYTKSPSFSDPTERTNTNMFFIQPGVSYYVNLLDGKFFYTPGVDLGLGFGGQSYKTDSFKQKMYSITRFYITFKLLSFELRPVDYFGISFQAGDLTYTFNQQVSALDKDNKTNRSSFNLGLNMGATIGFRYYF